jgi:hypothetical protein
MVAIHFRSVAIVVVSSLSGSRKGVKLIVQLVHFLM